MKAEYTAEQVASFLLGDADFSGYPFSEYQIGCLAVALDEMANWRKDVPEENRCIACHECANELTQMNSQDRRSIEPVVYALTGLSFSISWRGDSWPSGTRRFFVDQYERREPMSRSDFDALHDDCGWGSDAHRHALRTQLNQEQTL